MRIVTNINKADDVIVSMSLAQFKIILKEIEGLEGKISEECEASEKQERAWKLEYARTGKIAEFDEDLQDADLPGHALACTVWESGDIFGGKCSCGKWSDG